MNLSKNNHKNILNKLPVTLVLINSLRFQVLFKYNEKIMNVIKSIKSSEYDFKSRTWNISLSFYKETVKGLQGINNLEIRGLPISITKTFHNEICGLPHQPDPIDLVSNNDYLKVDEKIRQLLFPFQIKGVKFMIGRNGRCLLADDMGLGKTIQSLGAASFYRNEWPLLVISPSSVKIAWRDQIIKWISKPLNVYVISSSKDIKSEAYESLNRDSVVLVSYDLVSKMSSMLMKKNFQVIIMDESHFIKSGLTARAKSCIPLAKNAKRVFLLSGTPALSRPCEMFTQIDVVCPGLYNGYFMEFGNRYCDPQTTNWGVNYNGSSNTTELQVLLNERIMLRRLKNEVLSELPEKRREVIILAPEFLQKASLKRHAKIMMKTTLENLQRRGALLEYFQATGKVKIDAIKNYIDDLVESPRKFLFFAHHIDVLNAIEEQMIKKKIGYIRIDGSVNAEQKRIRAEKFQKEDSVQMAILSIVAAGTGINLTAASLVVFGELFWNPGILLQAENRCHRIGQKDYVNVQYLVAEQTADDYIWPLVQHKLELLTKVGLNKETFKNSETTRLEESFSEQNTILDYFKSDFMEEVKEEDIKNFETVSDISFSLNDSFDLISFDEQFEIIKTTKVDDDNIKQTTAPFDQVKETVDKLNEFTDEDFEMLLNDTDDYWEVPNQKRIKTE